MLHSQSRKDCDDFKQEVLHGTERGTEVTVDHDRLTPSAEKQTGGQLGSNLI